VKLALITPIDLLDFAALSDYHLVLPQLFDNERYRRFYTDAKGFKILDNGAAEGYTADGRELHDVALAIGAAEIVVPDCMGDCAETIRLARAFEPYVQSGYNYVGVAQGRTIAEVVKCITFFEHTPWITTLALPRILNSIHKTTRFNLIEPILKEFKFHALHCLGASAWVREVLAIADLDVTARGMDTSLPVVMGLAGRSLQDGYIARGPQYFDQRVERNSLTWKVIENNVITYFGWAGVDIGGLDQDTKAPPS
jgi:hypothetical protein